MKNRLTLFQLIMECVLILATVIAFILGVYLLSRYFGIENKVRGIDPKTMPQENELPKQNVFYAWNVPEKGLQSVYILRIVDGDTAEVAFLVPVKVRLLGIQAPEMSQPGGKEAKDALAEVLQVGSIKVIKLTGHDKYGRKLGDFWLGAKPGEPAWVSQWMLDKKFAKSYKGD